MYTYISLEFISTNICLVNEYNTKEKIILSLIFVNNNGILKIEN